MTLKITDHHNKYNNIEKVENILRITKMWHRDTEWPDTAWKVVLVDLLSAVLPKASICKFAASEKCNKVKHNKARYAHNGSRQISSVNQKRIKWGHPCSLQQYSQQPNASQVSINRWMDRQNVFHLYNGIVFSHVKEGNADTCYNTGEPWGHYAKGNKPVTYRRYLEEGNS